MNNIRPSLFSQLNKFILKNDLWKRTSYKSVFRPDFSKLKNPKLTNIAKGASISERIDQKIKLSGPITVADYMKEVLTDPTVGYYMNRDVFGIGGDFTTSPEISQLFGEAVGIWLFSEWMKLGSPKSLQIVELGPGRATLLQDVLKVVKHVSLTKNDLSIHLVEISPTLKGIQADRLCLTHGPVENQSHYYEGETLGGFKVYWYKDIKDVPKHFSLYVAHEFFDALPIHKFKKTPEGWREILIDFDTQGDAEIKKYRYVLSKKETVASKLYVPNDSSESAEQLEISPQSLTIAKELAERVETQGGIALIVDYGEEYNKGDTFRAFKNHKQVDPLENAGSADLTADVNFDFLKKAASYAKVLGPITQKQFLESCQADLRLQILLENAPEEQHECLKNGYNMLTDSKGMGSLFKFMAIFPTIDENHYNKLPVVAFMPDAIK